MSLDITPQLAPGRKLIQAYGDMGFRIAGERLEGSQLVFPEWTLSWDVSSLQDITLESLSSLTEKAQEIDILVMGCGPRFQAEPEQLRARLREFSISLEWMDTAAACRTFNILLTEERRVAAALVAVG